MANKTKTQAAAEAPAAAATENATPARLWVRVLKSGVHAEGCRFRKGARVKLAADVAERMIASKVAVRLPDYF